jgi:hypothetical protein
MDDVSPTIPVRYRNPAHARLSETNRDLQCPTLRVLRFGPNPLPYHFHDDRSTWLSHLGNIASRIGKKLTSDAALEPFHDNEVESLLSRESSD